VEDGKEETAPLMRMTDQVSSDQGVVPEMIILGRKRSIVIGKWPRAFRRVLSSSMEAWEAIWTGRTRVELVSWSFEEAV